MALAGECGERLCNGSSGSEPIVLLHVGRAHLKAVGGNLARTLEHGQELTAGHLAGRAEAAIGIPRHHAEVVRRLDERHVPLALLHVAELAAEVGVGIELASSRNFAASARVTGRSPLNSPSLKPPMIARR